MTIDFQNLTAEHIPLLRGWLKQPHVAEYWQESDDEGKFRQKFLHDLQKRGVRPFVICLDGQPIGYIQDYEACRIGGGWWPGAKPGTFGIDQFIGESIFVNKGIGTEIIREFVRRIFSAQSALEVITDPAPDNPRAIRAYEKAGFKKVGLIKTPGGEALLMRIGREEFIAANPKLAGSV